MCQAEYFGERGRLAQLGEHLPYKQGVIGSSPITPTIFNSDHSQMRRRFVRDARRASLEQTAVYLSTQMSEERAAIQQFGKLESIDAAW